MKNIFDYATKELSQDAFLMWLFDNLNDKEIDVDVKTAAIDLLNEFGINISYDDIEWVWVKPQWYRIDVSIHIKTKDNKYGIYIEDKTDSSEHNQLRRYNVAIDKITAHEEKMIVKKIYYKTNKMLDDEKRIVKEAGWYEYEFEKIISFWGKYIDSKNLIINNYANHINKIGIDSNNDSIPIDDNPTAWKAYFDNKIMPLLKGKYWCDTWYTRYGYSCLAIEPLDFPDHSPYMEVRSRDCTDNKFVAKILVYGVKDSKNRDYVKTIRENISSRESNGIFKCSHGEKQNKQLGKTFKNKYIGIKTDEQFVNALMESLDEFCEIVKFWTEE